MYENFYHLSDKPFEVTPDPKFLFLSPSHLEALHAILRGISERRGPMVVTGEVGTGKTTLIHAMLKSVDAGVKTAFIFHRAGTLEELLDGIVRELELPVSKEDRADLWEEMIRFANRLRSRDENLAVIIDEAHTFGEKVLEELLQRFFESFPRRLQLILLGQPELEKKLNSEPLNRFQEKIAVRCRIRPLTEEESRRYVDHRLRLSGSSASTLLTPEALALLCRSAGGVPRVLNILADNALLTGYGLSQEKIDVDIVREAIQGVEGPRKRSWLQILGAKISLK